MQSYTKSTTYSSQPSLFEVPAPEFPNRAPLASRNDPVTSTLAAAKFTQSGNRASRKSELLEWLRSDGRILTSLENSSFSCGRFERHDVAKRLPDLERDKLVRRCPERICSISGYQSITWAANG